jgi:hypothetical protein
VWYLMCVHARHFPTSYHNELKQLRHDNSSSSRRSRKRHSLEISFRDPGALITLRLRGAISSLWRRLELRTLTPLHC